MQDRLTYANGNTITTEGFKCTIGEPIDIIVDDGTSFGYNANIDTDKQMLVTLEVDGEIVCYRELHDIETVNEDELAIVVGDYTINLDANELTGEYTSARIRLEPVELSVSDAFRAAVGKVAPKSEGGSGGGVLVVGCTASGELGNVYTLDKTWQEIQDADYPITVKRHEYGKTFGTITYAQFNVPLNTYSVGVEGLFMDAVDFATNSASGYPTFTDE